MRKVVSCLVLFFLTFLIFCQSAEATFTKSSLDPVLEVNTQPLQPLSMPVPSVVQTESDYKMWFTEYSDLKHQIGLATSPDGINWTKYSSNPVLSSKVNDPWEKEIGEPSVIYANGLYTMWFTSLNFTQKESFRISRSTSSDGINWSLHQIIFTKSNATWESEGVNRPSVILVNGQYKMWYGARDSFGIWRIGYATSSDGISWSRLPTPVLQSSLTWESTVVASANVIFLDGVYHMYYHAGPIFPHYIGHATSSDGVNWTKDANQILSRGNNFLGDFDWNMIAAPAVIRVANKLRMYFAGHDGISWRIGYAEELLPVPYFSQRNLLWANDEYDNAHLWSNNTNSIYMENYGCAVTSAVMVLRHFNVNSTPGNPAAGLPPKDLTPGSLNEWLKSVDDGDFRNGVTNFQSIATMTIGSHDLNPTSPKLDYHSSENMDSIDEALSNHRPAILKLLYPHPDPNDLHFVVATSSAEATYNILDPYYADRATLSPYYNTVLRVDHFVPTNSNYSYLIFAIEPSVSLSLTDSNGNEVGFQEIELPIFDQVNQTSSGAEPLKVLYFKQPLQDHYILKISASGNESYQLDTYIYNQEGNKTLQTLDGIVGPTDSDTLRLEFDPVEAPNSPIQEITFETLIQDLNSAYAIGWIKNSGLINNYLKKVEHSQNFYSQGFVDKTKHQLEVLLRQLNKERGKQVNDDAYKILINDVETLLETI